MKRSKHQLLWEVTGPNALPPSYLFGTMHVRDQRAFAGFDQVLGYLNQCTAFAAEFDFAEADPVRLSQATQLPESQWLSAQLSPAIYKKLDGVVRRELGQPLLLFDRLVPLLLVNYLSEAQLKEEQPEALDQALYQYAQATEKTLLGLETFEEQLAVFDQLDLKAQYRSLKLVATHFKRFRLGMRTTTAAYLRGDIWALLHKTQRSIGKMKRPLLYDRNWRMANRFETYSAQQPLFAAVGAAHLAGERGLLRLLKHRGFKLRSIAYL